jgi:hypothetical protein
VEEVLLVDPDGARAEARDFHLAQGLGVAVVNVGDMRSEESAINADAYPRKKF